MALNLWQGLQHAALGIARSVGVASVVVALSVLIVVLSWAVYNAYFHPLSSFPGPKLWAATRLVWNYHAINGNVTFAIAELHRKYGPVVRIAPDELSYTTDRVVKTIYGHRSQEMDKTRDGHGGPLPPPIKAANIILADRADHQRIRSSLSHAFSDRALRDQEGYIQRYMDLLLTRLHERVGWGEPVQNMVAWFNWSSFDIIGDLSFGESFGCLDSASYHPWVANIFNSVKMFAWGSFGQYYGIPWVSRLIAPKKLIKARAQVFGYAGSQVDKRLESAEKDRKDFIDYMMRHGNEKDLSRLEMHVNANTLVGAGSETTATLLSGLFYYLCQTPHVYQRLTKEIRGAFESDKHVKLLAVDRLEYLTACLQEGMRIYPPAPGSFPRRVPPGGDMVDGKYVAGGMVVGINNWSAYSSEDNFRHARSFHPERWLDNSEWASPDEFAHDKKGVFQPFSYGPRNCLGRNLAWAEMRLLTARLLFNFDFALEPGMEKWTEQRIYTLWQKSPLMLKLSRVEHGEK